MRLLLAALFSLLCASAQAADLAGTIYWMSDPQPSGWGAPVTSIYYSDCWSGIGSNRVKLSICPGMGAGGRDTPYEQGRLIRIKSCQAQQILSDRDANGWFVVGSGGTPYDVFCIGGGRGGSHTDHPMLSGMIQGGMRSDGTPLRYIDVYSATDRGTQQMIVVLEYEVVGAP